jgi:hypothetical protein
MKLPSVFLMALLAGMPCFVMVSSSAANEPQPIPVILSTDIGGDVDDVWALSFMLASPELDVKLVVSDGHSTAKKGAATCRMSAACWQRWHSGWHWCEGNRRDHWTREMD